MRFIFIFLFVMLFLNCEDKQSKKKIITDTTETTSVKKEKKPIISNENKRRYPKLNSKNAMFFFEEYDKQHKENKVRLTTDFGAIDILLFEETKFHRANFIFLTKQGYFKDTQFYRAIDNFIIQGGNSDDKKTGKKRFDIGKYLLPNDTKRGFKHDRGVVSMPSSDIDNPHKLASPYEFFIVQQRGGAHFLNGDYTIFGKVIRGMDVVDKIAAVETDEANWPLRNVYIRNAEIIDE